MPLTVHSGTAAIDLNVAATYRQDISEVLLVSLTPQNNLLGTIQVGAEFAGPQLYWDEDALNQLKITGDTGGSLAPGATTMNVSQSDAAVMKVGYIISPDTVVGGGTASEQIQVTGISGTALTIARGYGGTTAGTWAQNTLWRIVNTPINPNSDLGPDLSRARLAKTNYINRFRKDVNIDSEQIVRSHQGYVPGIVDELGYQFQQRFAEFLRDLEQAVVYSIPPAAGNPTNDFQTMYGLVPWLDGTANATAAPVTTAEALTDTVLNNMVNNIFRQGAVSKVVATGPRLTQVLGALYSDTIRRDQSDRIRGFWTQVFDPAMANPHEIVNDAFINDTSGSALVFVLDPDRLFLRPQLSQGLYTIEAPSFRDGDALSLLGKWSLEVRNTGTDVGYAHQLHKNVS
jgi:hypothetical protein